MKLFIYSIISFLLLFTACQKSTIEIPYDDIINDKDFKAAVVIRGNITSEKKYQSVLLYTSSSYITQKTYDLSDAIVYLECDGNKYPYIESLYHPNYPEEQKKKGLYVSVDKIAGKPNYNHTLYVTYGTKTYTATDFMNPSSSFEFTKSIVPYIDISEYYNNIIKQNCIDTSLSTGRIFFGQQESFIIEWDLKCYFNYDKNGMIHYSTNQAYYFDNIESQQIMNNCFYYKTNDLFIDDDSIIVTKKLSLSNAYKQYLYEVFKETVWNATDFGTTPANVSTNVTNGGLGFFSAHDVYKKTITYGELFKLAEKYGNYGQVLGDGDI